MQLVEERIQCRGLNTRLSVRGTVMTISQLLPPENIDIPLSEVKAVELVVSSVFPPLSLFLLGLIFLVSVWWLVGGWSWPIILPESYKSVSSWAVLAIVVGLSAGIYVWLFARLRIATTKNDLRLTVHMVLRHSGEEFVDGLRRMMR